MALTTTTLSSAVATSDLQIVVANATGFAAGYLIKVDQEFMRVKSTYSSGTTIPIDGRGLNGTIVAAHVASANVTVGTGTDWADPAASTIVAYPLSAIRRNLISYSASGAITLPTKGEDMVAVLNGTSTLTMTLASPGKDIDGAKLTVIGNGKSASTVAYTTTGYGNAGASYVTFTFQTGGQVAIQLMACNGIWVVLNTPITGTSTSISVAIGA